MPPLAFLHPTDPILVFVILLFAVPMGLHLLLDRWSSPHYC